MTLTGKSLRIAAGALTICLLWAEPMLQPPPKPPLPDLGRRLAALESKVAATAAVNATAARALELSRVYLAEAQRRSEQKRLFAADRFTGAADALFHIAEHEKHLQDGGGPKGTPPVGEIKEHLQRVYFRVSQADFFLKEAHDKRAAGFPKWARDFYQDGLRAMDGNDRVAADEKGKCAEEVVKALENLAQAASPLEIPLPPGAPPPPR